MSKQTVTRLSIGYFCTILLLCSVSLSATADNAKPAMTNMALVKKIWNLNDDDLLLANIKTSIITGDKNLLNDLSQKQTASIKQILDANFAAIKTAMLEYMARAGRTTQLQQYYQWLDSPMGRKVSKMHLFAQMLFTDPEARIPVNPPQLSAARTKLQTRFINILFNVANSFQTATMEQFMALQNQTRSPEQRWSDITLEQQTKLATVNLSSITTQIMPNVFIRLFKDLSLEEVTVVVNFLNSETGRYYNDLLLDAFIHASRSTRPDALLQISKLFNGQTAILSQYSKVKLTEAKQRELMAMLIKQYGKPTIIRAMIDARNGEITIKTPDGDTKEVYGRPNHKLVTLDTLMTDLSKSGMDIRGFYKVLQNHLRTGQ
ncbi:MAG: hypothetical protein P8Z75_00875 [Gammaproteobacteria bacterium]